MLFFSLLYIIPSIIGLIEWNNKHQYKMCSKSNIYVYSIYTVSDAIIIGILSIIYYCNNILNVNNIRVDNIRIKKINSKQILLTLKSIAIMLWGLFELNVNCINNLKNTFLFKCVYSHIIVTIITSIISIILLSCNIAIQQ